jgi:hypothetical protein
VVRQVHLIAVVGTFLIGCAFLLLVVGCSGAGSEDPQEGQGHTEATKKEQGHSDRAASEEAARCDGTRTYRKGIRRPLNFTTNDLPDCPHGGLLLGTDNPDKLDGLDDDDEIRGLGAKDQLYGGKGSDVIYGGEGDDKEFAGGKGDDVLYGGPGTDDLTDSYGAGDGVFYGGDGDDVLWTGAGEDVLNGGDGNDMLQSDIDTKQRDMLYCGKGKDRYVAQKHDYVDSSCEKYLGRGGAAD